MTKDAVIQSFFASFLPAYPAISVPTGDDAPEYPYITYTSPTDADMGRLSVTASLWYRGTNWTSVNAMIRQMSEVIGQAKTLPCDDGAIIVRKGTPWAQPMGDNADPMVKRKILNFEFLYATTY